MIHQYLIPSYYSSVSNVFSSVRVDPSKIWHKYIFDQKILIELKNHQSRLAPLSVFSTASGALGVVPFSDTILYIIPGDRFECS